MRYPTVFQPCRIGRLTLKNRLAMSQMTMKQGVERVIRQSVPGIKEVIAV